MRMHPFHRTELLVGRAGFATLQQASVCVIGLGGVGSYAAEALARAGVGHLSLVDFDEVCITNLNRQLHATRRTVGQKKAALMLDRVKAINPKAEVRALELFYSRETHDQILDRPFDMVLDCIDNMTAKIFLLGRCVTQGLPVISAMGAGGRLDPTRVQISDISQTHTDPFARIVRENLRVLGIESGVRCVWTDEPPAELDPEAQAAFRCICPNRNQNDVHSCEHRLQIQGSCSWMPPIFGLTMAGAVVNTLLGRELRGRPAPLKGHKQTPSKGKPTPERRRALLEQAGFGRGVEER
ncbi:MAG: tRNA threonylcarbamoyladenosine dehydratase [Deltaproteobacteria bacterium]|nr:MAG: tRNA threonylcarbamoyladenosine dehydratase [Deltaproteobacteria bacterium]